MPGRVFKRNNIYWIGFSHRGKEYRKSSKSKKKREAERILAYYLGQCAREEFKGFQDDRPILTVNELFDDLIADATQRQLRDITTLRLRLPRMREAFGKTPAADLTERQIDLYVKKRFEAGRAPATLSCEMQCLAQAFKLAMRKKLLEKMPHIPHFKVYNARQGFFEDADFNRVVSFLPEYLQNVARFGYLTGWRLKEIRTLEWRDIEGDTIRLRPEVSKNAEGRLLIAVGALKEILDTQRALRKELVPYVFHRNGVRIHPFHYFWRKACKQAGVPGKLFHDLRRTAVRNMTRAKVPRSIAKKISGHKTDSIYERYDIVDETDIRDGLLQLQHYVAAQDRTIVRFARKSVKRRTV